MYLFICVFIYLFVCFCVCLLLFIYYLFNRLFCHTVILTTLLPSTDVMYTSRRPVRVYQCCFRVELAMDSRYHRAAVICASDVACGNIKGGSLAGIGMQLLTTVQRRLSRRKFLFDPKPFPARFKRYMAYFSVFSHVVIWQPWLVYVYNPLSGRTSIIKAPPPKPTTTLWPCPLGCCQMPGRQPMLPCLKLAVGG